MKKNFKQNILQNVKMDTQTSFIANGDIRIYPCPWESDTQVTDSGKNVRYSASVSVDEDGRTQVKRWNTGVNGPKYETLFETPHADVKRTRSNSHGNRGCLKVEFRFPRRYPLELMKRLFAEESNDVMAFMNSRKEVTLWQND